MHFNHLYKINKKYAQDNRNKLRMQIKILSILQ